MLEGANILSKELGYDRLVWVDDDITVPHEKPKNTSTHVQEDRDGPCKGPENLAEQENDAEGGMDSQSDESIDRRDRRVFESLTRLIGLHWNDGLHMYPC